MIDLETGTLEEIFHNKKQEEEPKDNERELFRRSFREITLEPRSGTIINNSCLIAAELASRGMFDDTDVYVSHNGGIRVPIKLGTHIVDYGDELGELIFLQSEAGKGENSLFEFAYNQCIEQNHPLEKIK